ncbi:probable LRR receptor-like serine/threonine-protein kinase At3g47570 [Rhodamnia argentea]|uniref:Probable LRR receptor-like serine/threonine-protein kinase At3g47570 n=1 Tax=Rhodamnia argentea TaxID=178133 RepID=A0ABM3HGA2_9MYRT|nr:probable LRR receptor-like serine/threonine-protein kinase At3g47570 [Rhodamnia argentea]
MPPRLKSGSLEEMGKQLFLVFNSALLWWWSSIAIPGACSQNQTDRLALASFRNAIHEDPFGVLSSWNDSTHHCEWQGVLCSKRHPGRVTSLVLRSQGLGGFLSPQIGNLSYLRVMILQNNSFRSEIPPQIGNLLRLRLLDLSNNSFDGPMPSNLSLCSNLETLNLIDNQLVGTIQSNLGSLPRLSRLGLTRNKLVGPIPQYFGNLSQLLVLSLAYNALNGEIPEELSRLERLGNFMLSFNELIGEIPPGIFNISSIYSFDVASNQLRGSFPSDIGITLPSLKFFTVANNSFTGTIPSSLTNATSLQSIALLLNNFHGPIPKNLGRLKGLGYIDLDANQLRDDLSFISSLANCSHLNRLSVESNLIDGSLPTSISNLSTSIQGIYLSMNQIQGTIPATLENLFKLSALTLGDNFLTGHIPDAIGALYSLKLLVISGNMLTGEIPSSIGNMTLLSLLHLQSNNFQGYIPQSLGNCKQLIGLNLSNNNLTGSVPVEILALSSLSIFLSLAHNNLSGSLPMQVGSLKNLAELDLSYNRLNGLIPVSISECLIVERLYLEANSFHGQISEALRPLRGLQELDLSNNNFSGPIPSFLAELSLLKYLNLSFNELEGQLPVGGVFLNASAVSISGNKELCGGVPSLKLPLCKLPTSNKSSTTKASTTKAIVIYVVAASSLCLALLFLSIFCYRKKKQTTTDASPSSSLDHQFLKISFKELLRATDRFSETNLIGKGRYGTVYKGILEGGATVAVKVLNLTRRGALRSFVSECQTLGTIRHRNLVKILSVCSSVDFNGNDFKALIYEFMANESLEEWLHPGIIERDDEHGESRNLRLVQRLNIAIDIATAIEYLHKGCSLAIVHGDLKPSNVLLDNDMVARVGDFGLAKIISTMSVEATGVQGQSSSTSTAVRGSIGYVPPEYGMGHKVSTQGDAYSYGILLLEMFTRKRPTEEAFGSHLNLHSFVRMALPDRMMDIIDLRLWNEAGDQKQEIKVRDCIISIFEVGVACSMESPPDRMDMTKAIRKLCSIKASYETRERMTGT